MKTASAHSEELETLRSIVADLSIRIEALEARLKPRPHRDPEVLSRILQAIGGIRGSEPFKCKELYLDPVLKKVLDGYSAKRLGKALSMVVGQDIGGLTVQRFFTEQHAVVWKVLRVVDPQ